MLNVPSVILTVCEDTLTLNFLTVILIVGEDTFTLKVVLKVGYRMAFVFRSSPLILGCTIWIRIRAMSPKSHFTFTIL